ncbi:MAG: hypothetical protein J6V72_11090 [Kiritimatiellae bacterium]|nr:hypothetical protein [Kiritimatiellia bacterium]
MAYGRIDDNGRLIRYGSKVKIDGVWVDVESADAAEWRTENGVRELVDDGGASCVCDDCEIPVATGWDDYGATIHRAYTATAIADAKPRDIARAVKGADVSAMTGDQKDALLQKLVAALSLALVLVFPVLATVQTARLGDLTSDSAVVTNVEEVAIVDATNEVLNAAMSYADTRATEEGVLGMNTAIEVSSNYTEWAISGLKPRYSWNRPDAWAIDVSIDRAELVDSSTTEEYTTDEAGRVCSNITYSATYQMAAQCTPRMLDESSMNFPAIQTWEALPPAGGTIDENGHFTATTSGLFRVCATDEFGAKKYADVALSAERTEIVSNLTAYVADDAAVAPLRAACHASVLAVLNAATDCTTNSIAGVPPFTTWHTFKPKFVAQADWTRDPTRDPGDWRCWAVSAHVMASANHHFPKRYNEQTFFDGTNTATVVKSVWYDMKDWALKNGFTAAEAATVDDLALIGCSGGEIPYACRPYFITPEKFERLLANDARMLCGWHISQHSEWAMPMVFYYGTRFTVFKPWGETRLDIKARLAAMDFTRYQPHGGDSGLPIFLTDGAREIAVAHFSSTGACRADYIAGYKIIKAFVEQVYHETLKEVE